VDKYLVKILDTFSSNSLHNRLERIYKINKFPFRNRKFVPSILLKTDKPLQFFTKFTNNKFHKNLFSNSEVFIGAQTEGYSNF